MIGLFILKLFTEKLLRFKQLLVHQLCPTRQALRFLGCSVVIEVSWLQWVLPRYLHQVGLGCLLKLGQNMAATAQWRAVHLEHLGSERRKTPFFSLNLWIFCDTGSSLWWRKQGNSPRFLDANCSGFHFSLYLKTNHLFSGLNALKSSSNSTENLTKLAQGFPTLKPSSWAQAYTEAVLPTPGGPVMRTVLHSGRPPSPSASVSPRKSPQSHTSYGSYSQRNCIQGFFLFIFFDQSIIANLKPEKKATALLSSLSFSPGALVSSQTAFCFHFFNQLHDKMIFFPQSSSSNYGWK